MPVTLTYTATNFFISNGVKKTSTSTFERSSASLTFSVTVINSGVGSTNSVGSVLHYPNAAAAAAATTPSPVPIWCQAAISIRWWCLMPM